MATNYKLDCFYCPNDKKIASAKFFHHTLKNHFDVVLCANTRAAENNRKALKDAPKFGPVELKFGYPIGYSCCLKCNSAVVKEASCRHYHFNPDEPEKNHRREHLQGCKDLLNKALDRMKAIKAAQEATPGSEPPPTSVSVKVVEKIVYVDRPVGECDPKVILKVLGALVNDCYKNDLIIKQSDEKINHLFNRCMKADEIVQKKDILINKLKVTSRLSPSSLKELENECDEISIVSNTTKLRDEINDVKDAVKRNDIYDPFDEHEEILNELKTYVPNLTNALIRKYLPKEDEDD